MYRAFTHLFEWQRNCSQRVRGFLWKHLHQALSTKSPKSPRPWRISLVLQIVYSGWLFIRDAVKEKFKVCKDTEYMTLLNLLDDYIPFVLTIYSTTFKYNKCLEYFNAMIRIRAMFMSLERHHYDKAPLVWIAVCTYWGIHNPDLYLMLRLFLWMFDEYPVENAHSIIRSKTNDSDTVEQLQQNAFKLHFKQKQLSVNLRHILHPHLASLSGKNNWVIWKSSVQTYFHTYSSK